MSNFCSGIKLFARSFAFLREGRKKYFLGLFLSSFEMVLLFITPYVNQQLIAIVTGESEGDLIMTLIWMLLLLLLFAPLVILGRYLQSIMVAEGATLLRKSLFRHIIDMPYEYITKYKTGDYITRLTADVSRTIDVFNSFAINNLIRFIVVFSISLVLLLVNDWRIAVVGVIYSAMNLIFSIFINPYAKRIEREAKLEVVHSASFLMDTLRGLPIIRVFTLHSVLTERYQKVCTIIKQKHIKYRTIIGITYGVVDFFAQSSQAVGFILGIFLAANHMALGDAVFNATLMGLMGDSVYRLSTFLLLIQPNFIAMERTYELLDARSEELKSEYKKVNIKAEEAIVFKNVDFSYNSEKNILSNFNLTVKNGENLAIVGGSGGGKSTVLKLIEGFYIPSGGEIIYFGRIGSTMSKTDIREQFAYVPQECALFDGTIGENIEMGRPGASLEEIRNVARLVNISDFVESLPDQYDTPLGEWGGRLSGGQKQRLAIARAILKGAPVLLLDEATSSLDSATEREVQSCLESISMDMTTITVAHRLSTVKNSNRIIVLESGKVVEQGNFNELMQKGGRFRELYDSQMRAESQI